MVSSSEERFQQVKDDLCSCEEKRHFEHTINGYKFGSNMLEKWQAEVLNGAEDRRNFRRLGPKDYK